VPPIHANEVYGAVARDASASAEGFGKKNSERFVRHLSGSHGELAMPPSRVRVAADPDVVGRIQEGRIDRSIIANDLAKEVEVTAIAATNAMLATNPDIAETGAGLGRNGGNRLVVRIALRGQLAGEAFNGFHVAARGEILEGSDADVTRCDAG
jgi:hypothetical protein